MAEKTDLLSYRESLDKICKVPDEIISVYSLEQHVWADGHSAQAVKERRPNLTTIAEFQIGPVLHFLNDIFRQMAAPYRRAGRIPSARATGSRPNSAQANPTCSAFWLP